MSLEKNTQAWHKSMPEQKIERSYKVLRNLTDEPDNRLRGGPLVGGRARFSPKEIYDLTIPGSAEPSGDRSQAAKDVHCRSRDFEPAVTLELARSTGASD